VISPREGTSAITQEPENIKEEPSGGAAGTKDGAGILDDMARFQQEVDELRRRFGERVE
jgi:hypothetical protein